MFFGEVLYFIFVLEGKRRIEEGGAWRNINEFFLESSWIFIAINMSSGNAKILDSRFQGNDIFFIGGENHESVVKGTTRDVICTVSPRIISFIQVYPNSSGVD